MAMAELGFVQLGLTLNPRTLASDTALAQGLAAVPYGQDR